MNGSSHRLIICVMLACGLLAQVPEPYAVSGMVLDARTGLPIAEVDVRVSGGGPTSTTNERGEFNVRVPAQKSRPTLTTSKRGYSGGVVRDLRPGMANLKIRMTPSRQLTGQVVDAETREPVAGLTVVGSPGSVRYVGRISGRDGVGSRTDSDGRFSLSIGQAASDLFVIVSPPLWTSQSWIQKNPTEADRNQVERDYEFLVWPGASSPLKLQGGNDLDAGVLALRKVDFYRANILFSEDTCEKGALYAASAYETNGQAYRRTDLEVVSCGEQFLLRGLLPGSYRVELAKPSADPQGHRWALMDFVIVDKNVDLKPIFVSGTDLAGRIVAADGARLPEMVTLALTEIDTRQFAYQIQVAPAAEARFGSPNVVAGLKDVLVGLPANYVFELRYRGVPIRGSVFRWDGGGGLEIVIDDRPATVKGKVKDGSAPLMYVIPWPMPIFYREEAHLSAYSAYVGIGGEFTRSGLLAGEYRVFASSMEAADTTVLRRLAERGERVTLGRGETHTVVIPVIDTMR